MIDGNTAAGLLRDLQKLDEAGRDRILNLLPPENVKEILKASLRELRRTANSTISQDQRHGAVHRETTRATGVKHGTETALEQNSSSEKRGRTITILRYRKRLRAEEKHRPNQAAIGNEIIEIESDEENDSTEKLSRDDKMSILPNEHIRRRSSRHASGVSGPTESRDLRPKTLPIFVYDGLGASVTIGCLPVHVRNELKRRFDNIWSADQRTIDQYAAYTRNPEKHRGQFRCIRNMLERDSRAEGKVSIRDVGPYKSADKKCVDAGYPCARFSWAEDEEPPFIICIVPLPSEKRKGKSWDELGYWILPEADATKITTAC